MPIEIKELSFSYDSKPFIDNLDLKIDDGEMVGIIGNTGCGKSTFVRLIAGLIKSDSGKIIIDGDDITNKKFNKKILRRKLGIVFQFPEMQLFEQTIEKDIFFGLKQYKLTYDEKYKRAKEALELLGLDFERIKDKSPLALSGGEKRKIAVAGILVCKPKYLIFDEPIAGLDCNSRDNFMKLLLALKQNGTTIIIISHNTDYLAEYADRILVMDGGKIILDDKPNEIFNQTNLLNNLNIGVCNSKEIANLLNKKGFNIQNDILKEYIARGTYIFPPRPSMRLITDTFEYCSKSIPKWNTISVGAYHIREAGASCVQEIAFAFANAMAYIDAAIKAGQKVDDFAPGISWIFTAGLNMFEEVAKFRAARRLWARIMKERYGATVPKAQMLRVHVHTAGSVLTAQQPLNNVARITWQALSAVLGGIQSMACCAYDEAIALPTEESATLALRTQQMLAYESGITDTIDPLAGSYYVEALTDRMEAEAYEYIKKIDAMGGAVAAIEQGYMQGEMSAHAYEDQRDIETKRSIVVGVNKFVDNKQLAEQDVLTADLSVAERQIAKVEKMKDGRDQKAVDVGAEASLRRRRKFDALSD